MKSGCNVLWTDHALSELENTTEYLENNWTERELRNFFWELDHAIELISKNPNFFRFRKRRKILEEQLLLDIIIFITGSKKIQFIFCHYFQTVKIQINWKSKKPLYNK